jgi:hypothetical protein
MTVSRWTRREWLGLCGAGASGVWFAASEKPMSRTPAVSAVDHLLLGTADLDRGIAWVEERTGVKAVIGGSHPGVGTRNALLSLGGRRYLEILAPDPAQTAYNFPIDVRNLTEPRLITWAAGTADIQATAKKAREAGYQLFGPREGSRKRPDGSVLQWKTLGVLAQLGGDGIDPVPFFIEWAAGSPHPSKDSPGRCELQTFEIAHPRVQEVRDLLGKLGIAAEVKAAEHPRLHATLRSPKGIVRLD